MSAHRKFTLGSAAIIVSALMACAQAWATGFNAYSNYVVPLSPRGVAIGDVNGDGFPDVVTANFGANNVSVLLGNGNGTFQNPVNYPAGSYPISVAEGDFNGDGIVDLAVADNNNNLAGGTLSILLGNGNGTFQSPVSYASEGSPFYLVVADVNGDGRPDVLVASHGAGVMVYLGNGDGTFQAGVNYGAGGNPQSIAVGDFNADGILDLAVANSKSNNVSILLGNGDGTFKTAVNYTAGTSPSVVAAGDFNNNGILDLAVTNNSSNTISILLGNGNGTFQPQYTLPTNSSPSGLAVTDVNGDGNADLVDTNQNGASESVSYYLGNGNGTFQAAVSYSAGDQPRIVAVGDVNHDGAPDLAVVCSAGGLNIFLNNGGTYPTTSSSQNPSTLGQAVTFSTLVAASLPGSPTPTGTVNFYDSSTLLGSGTLSSTGTATFTTSSLAIGVHTIYANYSGDANFNPNSAPPLTQTVNGVPSVVLTPTSLTFPTQLINTTSAPQNVTLSNTGSGPLSITSIVTSGPFAQTNTCGSTVAAGGSCTITVTFTPKATGGHSGKVTITDNAPGSPQSVTLSGMGTEVVVSPTSLNFGSQTVGTTSAPQTVTVMNTGTSSFTINSIKFSGANPGDFAQTNTCGSSVAGGASCTISVTFTPRAKGSRSATLAIFDTGGGSPQAVALSGTGM